MSFRITGLPAEQFQSLFAMSDAELAQRQARRVTADGPGYPCRVSLTDAAPGDELILLHYQHQDADTPFRASHAIYVRDVPASVAFYQQLFGFPTLDLTGQFCALNVGGRNVLLVFERGTTNVPKPLPGGTIPPHNGDRPTHLAFAIRRERRACFPGAGRCRHPGHAGQQNLPVAPGDPEQNAARGGGSRVSQPDHTQRRHPDHPGRWRSLV